MKIFYRLYCNGIMGTRYYRTYDEALAAAHARTQMSGQKWEVKRLVRPY